MASVEQTPLHKACEDGDVEGVRRLVLGANVDVLEAREDEV